MEQHLIIPTAAQVSGITTHYMYVYKPLKCHFSINMSPLSAHHFHWQATEVKVNEVDFNAQFISRMIPKMEWSALLQAADEVKTSQKLDTGFENNAHNLG